VKDARAEAAGVPVSLAAAARSTAPLADYLELTKPRLNLLVVVTSVAGCYLGAGRSPDVVVAAAAGIGTALVAGGAAVLNQVFERDTDRLMDRTRSRPVPAGRVPPADARRFGVALAAIGLGVLALVANAAAALLALTTLVIYLFVYTPMKRHSPAATLVGAIPGALPPLIGWTAGRGVPSAGGWTLFAIVFLWQIPHFMAIAWLYRDDYRKAGFPMLPVLEPEGRRAGRQAAWYAAALLPASLLPALTGVAGSMYAAAAVVLGIGLLGLSLRFAARRTDASARTLFFASITYLPLLWAAMITL
jgi:protoheme IX farnesyltransferase